MHEQGAQQFQYVVFVPEPDLAGDLGELVGVEPATVEDLLDVEALRGWFAWGRVHD
ncbi:hypothetical protein [Amycolatopsis sp. NPDC051371]|uniref:hypothetical protein n=1 Tax=Amycolatopsis sp. NPDC051371 TaxID=3155800 RepID=UPI0034192FDB